MFGLLNIAQHLRVVIVFASSRSPRRPAKRTAAAMCGAFQLLCAVYDSGVLVAGWCQRRDRARFARCSWVLDLVRKVRAGLHYQSTLTASRVRCAFKSCSAFVECASESEHSTETLLHPPSPLDLLRVCCVFVCVIFSRSSLLWCCGAVQRRPGWRHHGRDDAKRRPFSRGCAQEGLRDTRGYVEQSSHSYTHIRDITPHTQTYLYVDLMWLTIVL